MNSHQKSLSDRMKEYENVTNYSLYGRMPIILRIDGRAFHTLTKGMEQPYDKMFITIMDRVMEEVFDELSDAVLGYVQSDEISIVLCPYANYETEPIFSGRIQKICSVASSIATQSFIKTLMMYSYTHIPKTKEWVEKYINRNITFDCRCFNLQRDEVLNYLIWRQQDCKRNSILSAAQKFIGKKDIHGLKTPELIDKMLNEKGIDYWTTIPKNVHYGRSCYRITGYGVKIDTLDFSNEKVKEVVNKMVNFDYTEKSEINDMLENIGEK